MISPSPLKERQGFTLVELLAVIAVIGILAGIIIPTVSNLRTSSFKASALSNYRQVALAIPVYAQDHDGYLPGPLWGGQKNWYQADPRQLGYRLAPYLDLPTPDNQNTYDFPFLSNPFFDSFKEANPGFDGTTTHMNVKVRMSDGTTRNPWGYQSPSETEDEARRPMKLMHLANVVDDPWAFRSLDKGLMEGNPAKWVQNLPDQSLYGDQRLHVYFDWRAEFVDIEP